MLNIEKNIPIPYRDRNMYQDTVKKMKIGDSVYVEDINKKENFRQSAKSIGAEIVTKKENGGFRIWLTRLPVVK